MTRFEVTIRCTSCHHKYKRTLKASSEAELDRMPDPPCPKCKTAAAESKIAPFDVAGGRAPSVGGSLVVKATDYTMNATAEDYGMTDMRDFDKVREGEMTAPKLAPALQAQADNFFGGGGNRQKRNPMGMSQGQMLKAAVGGRFSTSDTPNPVAMHAQTRKRPPVNVVASDDVVR
jgi:phage FluMu protein Com